MNNNRRKFIREQADALVLIRERLELLRDEEQEAYDNMPEGLQAGEKGEKSQEAIDNLDGAITDIECAANALEEATV